MAELSKTVRDVAFNTTCPFCRAGVAQACRRPAGSKLAYGKYHVARTAKAERMIKRAAAPDPTRSNW